MIHLENVMKMCLQDVLKMSWRRLQNFLKTSWICLKDVFQEVLKTFWRRFEDILKTYGQDEYIGLEQDVLKTSSEVKDERRLQDIFKASSSRRMFAGLVLTKANYTFWRFSDTCLIRSKNVKNEKTKKLKLKV